MDKVISVTTLPLRGGHPSLDFANTVDSRRDRWGPDVLVVYGDLLAWAERTGVLSPVEAGRIAKQAAADPGAAEAALVQAKELREAIYDAFSALAADREAPEISLDILCGLVLEAQCARRLTSAKGTVAWIWSDTLDLHTAAHRLAVAAADLLTRPEASRVKECLGRNCGWLFLDTSRNGSRRWCSDAVCGSLARVTKHRSKGRAEPKCEEP